MSGWTKLFSSITTSSIWCEGHATRIVWIAMLAEADADGVVQGSIPGFANLARVTVDEMRAAVEVLSSPDPDSRTPDYEGRRIEAIAGGWLVLNHGRYREKAQAKEGSRAPYYRDYRKRKAAEAEKAAKAAKAEAQQKAQQANVARNTEERGEKREAGTDTHTHAREGLLLDEIACPSCSMVGFLKQSPERNGHPPGFWCRRPSGCGFNFPLHYAPIVSLMTSGAREALRSMQPKPAPDSFDVAFNNAQEGGLILRRSA